MEKLKVKKTALVIGIIAITTIIFLPSFLALAADDLSYTVLAPLPCIGSDQDCQQLAQKTELKDYVPGMFKLLIGLSAVWAVLMIVLGGIQYITTDAVFKKEEGRKRIENAIYGLLLVIGAWLILNTINPNLLEFNLNIEKVETKAPAGGVLLGGELSAGTGKALPWYPLSPEQIATNKKVMDELSRYGVGVNAGPCTTQGQTTGCTNLVGMPDSTFRGVVDLKKVCGSSCNIEITGGTEGGHRSHGPNLDPIDLRFDSKLDKYIIDNRIKEPTQTSLGPIYTSRVGNRNATFLKESDHWHVRFE